MKDAKQVIVMRKKFPDSKGGFKQLRRGKQIAQGSHASMIWMSEYIKGVRELLFSGTFKEVVRKLTSLPRTLYLSREQVSWLYGSFTKVCVGVETEEELDEIYQQAKDAGLTVYMVTDAGKTEFHGVPTKTCLAIGPHYADKIDKITGHLKLL